MKKRNIWLGLLAVLLLFFIATGILLFRTVKRQKKETEDHESRVELRIEEMSQKQKEEETAQDLSREISFWTGEDIQSLYLLDLDSLSFQIEQNSQYAVEGIISCYDFEEQQGSFRLLVYMENDSEGNHLCFRLYLKQAEGYELFQSWRAKGTLFGSFRDMEDQLKVYVREDDEGLRLICSQKAFQIEGNTETYQIFQFNGENFEETLRLELLRETVNVQVKRNDAIIYESLGDDSQVSGSYQDSDEAVSRELEQAGLAKEDFEKPETAADSDICFLASARTGDSWLTGEFSGEVNDYTKLRVRLEELGISWKTSKLNMPGETEKTEQQADAEMKQAVANEDVEAETLHVREVFNEQVACTASGGYEPVDLGNGFTAWLDRGKIMVIKTRVEDVTETYEEIYNFEEGKLIFAFDKKDGTESRFYYKDDSLFRWCYPDFETQHDNEYDNPEFVSQGTVYQNRGYDLYALAESKVQQ
ncbi:MAG: hypothetical protein ACOX8E_03345 [Ruminococcus sp.]|jgi:hypothetical protein